MMHLVLPGLAVLLLAAAVAAGGEAGPIRVEIRRDGEKFQLYRGGQPYYIKGAVYWSDPSGKFPLSGIVARGGNSVRCGGNLKAVLDEARRLGATVTLGLPMKMEAVHGFNYSDEKAVREQAERTKAIVTEFRDHPALLLWGIGNELSVNYKDKKVWGAVNEVARMIHDTDPNHPVMTVIGDGSIQGGDIQEIKKRCPDLDLLGINYYKGIETVPAKIRADGWDKPYVITEWGPSGDWQVPRTKWGAAIEETSTEKAQRYLERYQNTMLKDPDRCLGSYVFIWLSRRERTHTWYGMFIESGERTEAVNVMQYLWTGKWPPSRAPKVEPLRIDGQSAADNVTLKPGSAHVASIKVTASEGDHLAYRWEVVPEVARAGYAGMGEKRSEPMPDRIREDRGAECTFIAPDAPGPFRVFVFVLDGHGNAATANIPFLVQP
ncbi:MAG TPA: glycoside hydrolase family 2 TIM barrel-domain containing protein [Phycisphaerae bacterium]|nr:glycoside hydrolase family 2 TIM barrel-domain containing protein [Planctomycetota bacterium]HUT59915.1 glycoside hydrolase family 2 TIM barrel-domain containing protein [Phycisphaerae bacterium]